MVSFRKPIQAQEPAQMPEQPRSHFQALLDEYSAAFKHLDRAGKILSSLQMSNEKGLSYVERFCREITQAIQAAGGTIDETARIEEEIAEYVGNHVRAENGGNAGTGA